MMRQSVESYSPCYFESGGSLQSGAARLTVFCPFDFANDPTTERRSVGKKQDVLVTGRHYTTFFVNHDGWLLRYKILHNGDRQILDFILPGQIFGLQACMFEESLYSVATITDTVVSVVPLEMLDRIFEHNLQDAKVLLWSAICESAVLGEHLVDTARRSAYQRVSHFLLELFARLRKAGLTNGMSFSMPLTQELIGDALGLTTVHVNRTLRSLRKDKLIEIGDKQVTILDAATLSLICDFDSSYLGGEAADAAPGKAFLAG